VREESAAVAELAPARRDRDADAYQRIKGASRLSQRSLAVLRELHAWREGLAAAADKPAFRVLGNDALLTLATTPPASLAELGRVRGVLPRLRRQAPAILQGVEKALALPERELPRFPRTRRRNVSDTVKRRVAALRAWRDGEARRLGVDVSVVLPVRLLEQVAEAGPRERDALEQIEGLRRWRVEAFGPALLEAVRAA
jgi:ribonuclease D